MTISSIHFQKAQVEFAEKHNFRTEQKEPEYLLEKRYRKTNEYLKLHDVKELYQEQMTLRKQNHCRGFAPSLKDVYWEAVVNLNESHSLDDVKKVADFIQQKYKLQTCSIAIHHDEGYKDKNDTVKYNNHAHLCFLTMENGISAMRKIRSKELRQMQTEVAQLLGMERGKENSKAVRLDHKQYRQVQKDKSQQQALFSTVAELAIQKNEELKSELLSLKKQKAIVEEERKTYKEQGDHIAEDYRKLQALNKTLHTQEELNQALEKLRQEYKERLALKDKTITELQTKNTELNDTVNSLKSELETKPKEVIKEIKVEVPTIKTVTVERELTDDEIENLPRVQVLNSAVNNLTNKNSKLQENLDTVTQDLNFYKNLTAVVFQTIQAIHSDFDIEHPIDSLKKIYNDWKNRTQKSSISTLKRSTTNENTIERVEVLPSTQNRAMSILEQNTTEEKKYEIPFFNYEPVTVQDIRDYVEDYPEDKDNIAQQLSESDRREVFYENQKEQRHSPRVDHHFSR